jgi:hypothetical protein
MLNFHDHPHMGKPADVTFMHLSTPAEHLGAIITLLICHICPFFKGRLNHILRSFPARRLIRHAYTVRHR